MAEARKVDPNETVYQSWMRTLGAGLGRAAEFIPVVGMWNNLVTPNVERLNAPANPAAARAAAAPTSTAPGGFGGAFTAAMGGNPAPSAVASSVSSVNPLDRMTAITAMAESRNRDVDANGRTITSSAGAQGRMQVMPGTNRDPGYGVRPAANDSHEERTRVGRDYLAAMMRQYGNDPAKAWAAYNWGPGNLDRALQRHGNNWLQHAPGETQAYVTNNLLQLGAANAGAVTAGSPFVAPSPSDVMNFIPAPSLIPHVNLPDAVQLEAPAARPQYEVVDPVQLLAGLRAASQVPERDRKGDAWERVQGLLAGAARGLAQAGPGAGFGEALAAAGALGNEGFTSVRAEQRAKDEAVQQLQQQLNIALERAGIDVNIQALGQRNTNLDQAWLTGNDQITNRNTNSQLRDQRAVQNIDINTGIDQANVGATNQANAQRGSLGAQAYGAQFDAANQGTAAEIAAASRNVQDPGNRIDQTLTRLGVVPTDATRGAAVAMGGGNPAGALPFLAQDLLASPLLGAYLGEQDTKKVQDYLRDETTKPMALAIIQQALQADYTAPAGSDANNDMQKLLEAMANSGSGVARVVRGQ